MKYNRIGNSALTVSEICLGTMTFGEQTSEQDAHHQLDWAVSRGINFLDTAELYPVPARGETQGRSETIIGNWLKHQRRENIVLASKVAGPRRNMAWLRNGPQAFDRDNIETALNGSLQRLQTDYLDLYWLHWPARNTPIFGQASFDPELEVDATPIQETLEVLADLVHAGKIRYIGLSNETPWGVSEFVRIARAHNLPVAVGIQNAYHLLNRTFEMGLSEVSYRENIPLMAYSPLAFGHLTGKYLTPEGQGRITLFPAFGQRYDKPYVRDAVAAYVQLAQRHQLTPAQLAIAFVRSRWFVASTIITGTSLDQLEEDLAENVTLDKGILEEIAAIHARYTNPAP